MDTTPETQTREAKIDKWDYVKPTSFCTEKEKKKTQQTEEATCKQRKVFPNHTFNKALLSKKIRNTYNSLAKTKKQTTKNKTPNIPLKNGQRI